MQKKDNMKSDPPLPQTPRTGSRSQTTFAYEKLRADIVDGTRLPNSKLKISEISEELEVSPGAVREALSRLVPEQLVVSRDQKGFVVAPLSISDLQDLTNIRCDIEEIALRRSVELGDVNWEASILAAEHRLRGFSGVLDQDWIAAHAAFHAALVSACGSPRLIVLHAQLYEQSERYRGLALKVEARRNVADEHRKIMNYALARDADNLVKTTLSHMRKTTKVITEAAQSEMNSDQSVLL